jgi:uncharacterized glyoxalase superfamily protein PhnB
VLQHPHGPGVRDARVGDLEVAGEVARFAYGAIAADCYNPIMLVNRSMPRCPVIPVLEYPDVGEAIRWLCDTFGFTERWRASGHRAQLAIGDAAIALVNQRPLRTRDHYDRHAIMIRVEDIVAHHAHAHRRGATMLEPPTDFPYGERQYSAIDFAGHRWTFSQSMFDVVPEEWGGISGQIEAVAIPALRL